MTSRQETNTAHSECSAFEYLKDVGTKEARDFFDMSLSADNYLCFLSKVFFRSRWDKSDDSSNEKIISFASQNGKSIVDLLQISDLSLLEILYTAPPEHQIISYFKDRISSNSVSIESSAHSFEKVYIKKYWEKILDGGNANFFLNFQDQLHLNFEMTTAALDLGANARKYLKLNSAMEPRLLERIKPYYTSEDHSQVDCVVDIEPIKMRCAFFTKNNIADIFYSAKSIVTNFQNAAQAPISPEIKIDKILSFIWLTPPSITFH